MKKNIFNLIINLASTCIHGLLILWIGLLSPLVFFNNFATSHIMPPYRIALFEPIPRSSPQRPNEITSPSQWQQRSQQSVGQHASLIQWNPLSGLAQSLISAVGYLSMFGAALLLLLLGHDGLKRSAALRKRSADLPPPDKPPRLNRFAASI